MRRKNRIGFFFASVLMLLGGNALSAPPAMVSTLPSALPASDTFTYTRVGKADPFRPFIDLTVDKKKQEEQKRKAAFESALPLLSMPLESFRLVGIAGNEKKRVAVVVDPMGRFYPLSVGMLIGENRAKIVSIQEKKLILEERPAGRGKARRTEWVLKSPEDEGRP